ncbi:MAG: flavodoxin family protein [Clostridia bacterium]|nr:flavodoxin family protein [Clostridia bacterium]
MKKIGLYVFSATGNTMKIARLAQEELTKLGVEAEIKKIENGKETHDGQEDTVVIMYPVHGINAHMNVMRFFRNLEQG